MSIKRKMTYNPDSARGQRLAQRQQALEVRKAATFERTDIGPAYRAQILAEIAVMEADFWTEVDQWLMAEEIDAAQALAEAEGIYADEAVAATDYRA